MRCRGLQRLANAAYLEGFPFPALLRVARYCVPGGIRVASTEAWLLHDPAGAWHTPEVRRAPRRARQYPLTLDPYSDWISSMGRSTSDGIDEALG
jgi:hypothetical protein